MNNAYQVEVEDFNVLANFFSSHFNTICNTLNTTFCHIHLSTTGLIEHSYVSANKFLFALNVSSAQQQAQAAPYQREEIALRFEKKMLAWQLTNLKTY